MKCIATGVFPLCLAFLLVLASPARPIWFEIGVTVCTAPGSQLAPEAVYDGSGGIIIVWTDCRESGCRIYAQRLDANGNALWNVNGVRVCTSPTGQTNPMIVSGGSESVIIAWEDERIEDSDDVYAQKLDLDGIPQWPADGVAVCAASGWQRQIAIATDEPGGAVIAWTDNRTGDPDDRNIYAQRILANGSAAWTSDGVAIATPSNWQQAPVIATDGYHGAIIAWQDLRTGVRWRLYAQRVDSIGAVQWTADGVRCTSNLYDAVSPKMVSDRVGGAIIAWQNLMVGGDYDVYAQRIDPSGSLLWGSNGVLITDVVGSNQVSPQIDADGTGSAVIAWEDYRNGNPDIYALRLNLLGGTGWTANGVAVCTDAGDQLQPSIVSDGDGGVFVAWNDYRDGTTADIYAQWANYAGTPMWTANGLAVSQEDYSQMSPCMVTDGVGGGITLAWQDERSMEADIYAQHVSIDGEMQEYPAPYIIVIEDVPDDEGGKVRLYWEPSRLDVSPGAGITDYELWKRVPDGMASSSPGAGDAAKAPRIINGYTWEWLFTYPASQQTQYSVIVPTSKDWTPSDPAYESFKVVALTSDPLTFNESPIDSGYSQENIAPATPQGFSGVYMNPPGRTNFNWLRNTEPDLSHYAVHSGTPEYFYPDETNLLGTTTDTTLSFSIRPTAPTYYKLLAVDISGNASVAAVLSWEDIPLGTLLQGFEAAFTGSCVEISWTLSEAGKSMQFRAFRARGAEGVFEELSEAAIARERLSFSFHDERCEPGETYRYRIDVSDDEGTRTLFETETISIPAMPLTLFQNHPNPFNPSTRIRFYLPERSRVRLDIYDIAGARVATIVDASMEKGFHVVGWNGADFEGRQTASGVYLYRLTAGKKTTSMKMILLR